MIGNMSLGTKFNLPKSHLRETAPCNFVKSSNVFYNDCHVFSWVDDSVDGLSGRHLPHHSHRPHHPLHHLSQEQEQEETQLWRQEIQNIFGE